MDNRWPDYAYFPANGADFVCYVGTVLEDLGYGVSLIPPMNNYGVDLILAEPGTGKIIAVQTKFSNGSAFNDASVQEMVTGVLVWGASEGWVITNASAFSSNACQLAQANRIRLMANDELSAMVAQAMSLRALNYPTAQASVAPGAAPAMPAAPAAAAAPEAAWSAYAPQTTVAFDPITSEPAPLAPSTLGAAGPRFYTLTDVRMRWNCSDGYVREQMQRGLPLYKQADGRYVITEPDLLGWEQMMMAQPQMPMPMQPQKKSIRLGWLWSILITVVVIGALLAAYIFLAPPLFDAIEADNPGLHIVRWTDIIEQITSS